MTQIDWNEAPDWAMGHGIVVQGAIKQVWYGEKAYMIVGDSRSYCYGGGDGDTRHNHMPNAIQFKTPRPATWTCEGLPPVGTVCEAFHQSRKEWLRVKVLDRQVASECCACRDDKDYLWWSIQFRPIRTPAQLAAEEREKAISNMKNVFDACSDELMPTSNKYLDTLFGALHDAGLRFEAKP